MSTKLFNETTSVEKRFGMTLKDFETRIFVVPRKNCSVCDESDWSFNVRHVEPTFTDDPDPEYEFLHDYEFLSAKLLFENPTNASEKVFTRLLFLYDTWILYNIRKMFTLSRSGGGLHSQYIGGPCYSW